MSSKYSKQTVFENIEIAKNIFKMTISGDYNVKPGQFYMLRSWGIDPFLSRPISIHDVNENGIVFLYEVRGEGTRLFSTLRKGDSIELLGPIGNGFDIENIKGKVAMITGGIGIAPLYYTVKELKDCTVDFYAGFRDEIYSVDYIKEYTNDVKISTNTGSHGHKGLIIDIFNPKEYEVVLCCGPTPMMEKVTEICNEANIPAYVSLESHMACGVGACLGCTCKTTRGRERICKEGPVFLGKDVFLDA
ncbi:dihydroorotate dehydrogenase B (NAD(+)), electron transfer subunit [Gottschalkia purinilytica]|uniref:Dihydroorotate dehydrogenase B (NAD(+)), electron transfer subunit n=1 Tax=Gottschalkia purinilytica TaxID=1503 RepID=A0A0L0W6Q3_GOTPU|nr:dihydroorotate dehydrogenase electron transfer subunit [Gottschalkia purinilytica]KNF07204.1 dihydroorotate dehydrogenase B (NAD(+)), electron transfer subunit [Gottschalkia purinilytica]